jgi:hypothetical protein
MENNELYMQANLNVSIYGDNFINVYVMQVDAEKKSLSHIQHNFSFHAKDIRLSTGWPQEIYSLPIEDLAKIIKLHGKRIL